ncbi:MAG: Cadmium, cobalt and zinc/H(+)-K(+) antiporter [Pseudomonadota bacterium]|jgi:cobalt-zinc-cadmium efflux system protein
MLADERLALALISWVTTLIAFIAGVLAYPAGSAALLALSFILVQLSVDTTFAFRAALGLPARKNWSVRLQGIVMIILGALVCAVVARLFLQGSFPHPRFIMAVGVLALFASLVSWAILLKYRGEPADAASAWRAGRPDVVNSIAVVAAGLAVALTGSNIPDLVIGGGMAAIFVLSGWRIAASGRLDAGRPG